MGKEKVVEKKEQKKNSSTKNDVENNTPKKTSVKVEEKKLKKVNSKNDNNTVENEEKKSKKVNSKNDNNTVENEGEKRPNKYTDVDKGDCPNKATAFAKLYFNVKTVQKWMREYFLKYSIERKKSTDNKKGKPTNDKNEKSTNDKQTDDGKIKILNSHYAMTATDQVICLSLVNLSAEKSKKAAAGLYTITEENMLDNIKMNKDFNYTFGRFLDSYDSCASYSSQMGLNKTTIQNFIETYGFNGGNTNINLDNQAFNLLMYVMLKNRILLAETAFQMITYARKSSIDDRSILCSIKINYTGQLRNTICKKVEDVTKIIKGTVIDKDNDSKKGSKESKSNDDKKSDKNKKKSAKDSDNESEASDNNSDNESDNESDDESEDESESDDN